MLTDAIVLLAFGVFAVLGFTRGFIKSAVSLIKVSISAIVSFLISRPIASVLDSIFGFDKALANAFGTSNGRPILIAIIAIIIFLAIRLVLHKLVKFAEKSREQSRIFNIVDRWLGAVFGVFRFLFLFSIISVVFYMITRVSFIKPLESTVFDNSEIAFWLYRTVSKLVLATAIPAIAPK